MPTGKYVRTPEMNETMRAVHKAKWLDPEFRAKQKAAMRTPEAIAKMQASRIAHWAKPESREQNARRLREIYAQAGPNHLEAAVIAALTELGVEHEWMVPIDGFLADILIRRLNLIIECDGPWHSLPESIAKDQKRDARLEAAGYRVVRLKASAITTNAQGCVEQALGLPRIST